MRSAAEKAARAAIAVSPTPEVGVVLLLYCDLKLRSQTARSARPWATLARRATVQGVLASKSLSSVSISHGCR